LTAVKSQGQQSGAFALDQICDVHVKLIYCLTHLFLLGMLIVCRRNTASRAGGMVKSLSVTRIDVPWRD